MMAWRWRAAAGPVLLACALVLPASGARAQAFPLPLEADVPAPPAPFASGGAEHLVYEIYLRNSGGPLTLESIQVLDPDRGDAPLAALDADALAPLVRHLGRAPADGEDPLALSPGASAIVFLSLPVEAGAAPAALRHRITTSGGEVLTGALALPEDAPPVFVAPVRGEGWRLSGGPDNDSGHRRGMIVFDGRAQISRRFAMDWTRARDGSTFSGDARDNGAYHAWDREVLAVADALVVAARDGVADNTPGERPQLTSLDGVPGNFVTLEVAPGIYARYMHLQNGSVRVQVGDRVRRGETIGLLGNSGDSQEPHLHFETTTTAGMLGGEGIPYLLEEYSMVAADGALTRHVRELPIPDDAITLDLGDD